MKRLTVLCLVMTGGFVVGGESEPTPSLTLIKIDSESNVEWRRDYGSIANEFEDLKLTPDGGYIMVGTVWLDTNYDSRSIQLVKLSPAGDLLWSQEYEPCGGYESGYSVKVTSDSGYILLGESLSELVIVKTDPVGEVIWSRCYGDWNSDHSPYGSDIIQTSDGGYMIVGTAPYLDFYDREEKSNLDVRVMKIDSTGDSLWSWVFGDSRYREKGGIIWETLDGGYLIKGVKNTKGSNKGYIQWWVKTDSLGHALWDTTTLIERVTPKSLGVDLISTKVGDSSLQYIGLNALGKEREEALTKELNEKGIQIGNYQTWLCEDGGNIILGNVEVEVPEGDSVIEQVRLIKLDKEGKALWNLICQDEIGNLSDVARTPDRGYIVILKNYFLRPVSLPLLPSR